MEGWLAAVKMTAHLRRTGPGAGGRPGIHFSHSQCEAAAAEGSKKKFKIFKRSVLQMGLIRHRMAANRYYFKDFIIIPPSLPS
jgi:hypothetical protein